MAFYEGECKGLASCDNICVVEHLTHNRSTDFDFEDLEAWNGVTTSGVPHGVPHGLPPTDLDSMA
jgi:hypothetical protein